MATKWWLECASCKKTEWPGKLLETFDRWTKQGGPGACPVCSATYELRLLFPFAFGADGFVRVVDIFSPDRRCEWIAESGHRIAFRPFLVIAETIAQRARTAWLPYWHVDDDEPKYRQWAPNMDLDLFASLVKQARERGHLQ